MLSHGLKFARKHPKLVVKTSYKLARRPRTVLTGVRTARAASSAVQDPEIRQQVAITALAMSGVAHRLRELKDEPPAPPRRRRVLGAAATGAMLAGSALLGHAAARKLDD